MVFSGIVGGFGCLVLGISGGYQLQSIGGVGGVVKFVLSYVQDVSQYLLKGGH